MSGLEAELRAVHDAQKRNIEATAEAEKRATDIATQLALSLRLITEVEEDAKVATARMIDMQKQLVESKKTIDDAQRRLSKMS